MANDMQTTQQRRTNPVAAFIDEIRQPSYLKTYGELLPEGVAPERFVRSVVTAVTADPSLLNCNRKSLFFAIRKAAQLGLDCSGVNGEGWLVQVNKKGQQEKNVEYWIGYRGHIKLARQSGEISSFECEIIHENDHVVYKGGITPIFEVEFNWKDPGEPVAVYAVARFKDGGHQLKVIGKAELTEIKTRAIGNRKFTPWNTDEPAMWRKTALHRLCSLLPTSAVDLRVIDADHYVQHE
ncbi:MAG: recombinase RecT, partial [Verrucomicrobiales bacterium]|nr:recombinase RecT [Verrucomicrobiales bacterium]